MIRRLGRLLLIVVVALMALYFVVAFALTFSPAPSFAVVSSADTATATSAAPDHPTDYEEHRFAARDGVALFARHYPSNSGVTVLLIHGVTGDGSLFQKSATMLRDAGAEVYVLDLRGHGRSGGTRGDIDYIGQYEADVADVVTALRALKPENKIVLAGHSMGGGIALRYAVLDDESSVDGYLLFAPNLGTNAPTAVTTAPEEGAGGAEEYIRVHVPRTIGLIMLNIAGITAFDHLPTMFFNLPPQYVNTYSYRAMATSAPTDYVTALTAVDKPMLVVVGSHDEAFNAARYPATVQEYSDGEVHMVAGETHTGIYQNAEAMSLIHDWLTGNEWVASR